jgi:hypothetical protein
MNLLCKETQIKHIISFFIIDYYELFAQNHEVNAHRQVVSVGPQVSPPELLKGYRLNLIFGGECVH